MISASWYATPNIAVELWGAADKFNHRVRADGAGKIGTVDQQPIALSGQYHFGTADQVMRPFVGLGYYESNFSNETIGGDGATYDIGFGALSRILASNTPIKAAPTPIKTTYRSEFD